MNQQSVIIGGSLLHLFVERSLRRRLESHACIVFIVQLQVRLTQVQVGILCKSILFANSLSETVHRTVKTPFIKIADT